MVTKPGSVNWYGIQVSALNAVVVSWANDRNAILSNNLSSQDILVIGSISEDALKCLPTINADAWQTLWQVPAIKIKRKGRNLSLTAALNFAVKPPWLRLMNPPARSSNQRGAQRFHPHHGNVDEVFQRHRHRTISRSVDGCYCNIHKLSATHAKSLLASSTWTM